MNKKEAGIIAELAVLFKDNLIIAGGYYRDLDNGRPFKDIDVFIVVSSQYSDSLSEVASGLVTHLGFTHGVNLVRSSPGIYEESVFTAFQVEGTLINLILTLEQKKAGASPIEQVLSSFDIGLCKIAYCPYTDEMVKHEDYLHDKKNKKITVVKSAPNVQKHLVRICDKYSDWAVAYPWSLPEW